MISVTDLRPGTKVKMDGGLWECVEYQHQKLGRGGAKVVAKFKNLETGAAVQVPLFAGAGEVDRKGDVQGQRVVCRGHV